MAAANNQPVFSKVADIQGVLVVTAPTTIYNMSGAIGTDVYKAFTADATNGGYLNKIIFKYVANATTQSNAAVAKIWLSSLTSGTPTVGTQAWYIGEIVLPSTSTLATTTQTPTYDFPLGFPIPAGYTVLIVISVSQPANCGWLATVVGGKY